jgi:superfamily II DNA helicase RecQ
LQSKSSQKRLGEKITKLSYSAMPSSYCAYELIEILNQKPQDLNAMGQISGVGQAKLDRYGAAFLAVIAEVD